jgi:hypothetical protein
LRGCFCHFVTKEAKPLFSGSVLSFCHPPTVSRFEEMSSPLSVEKCKQLWRKAYYSSLHEFDEKGKAYRQFYHSIRPDGFDGSHSDDLISQCVGIVRMIDFFVYLSIFIHKEYNMEPLSIIEIMQGLGNQMFQYAFFLALKSTGANGSRFFIDTSSYKYSNPHNGYELDTVFGIPPEYTITEEMLQKIHRIPSSHINYMMETDRVHNVVNSDNPLVTIYSGCWQTEAYFLHIASEIRNSFRFNETNLNKTSKVLLHKIKQGNSVSLHIRRGDYVNSYRFRYLYDVCSLDYYYEAISIIRETVEEPVFYIFSNDPGWVKENLKLTECVFVDCNHGRDSWQDMCLMSACKHHIIANSSFSWWGAWFGNNKEKTVIAPEPWLNSDDITDIWPEDWIKIRVKPPSRIADLKDTTFVIPFRLDSKERESNLDVLLEYIHSVAKTSVVVLEIDTDQTYTLKKKYANTSILHVQDTNPVFYKTACLNSLFPTIKTPVIGVLDSDVIIPVEQIEQAVQQIRSGNAVMSFPYDGYFCYVSEELSHQFKSEGKISFLKRHIIRYPFMSGIYTVKSAFFFDRSKYLTAGGENMNLSGWGLEDIERVKRIEILGLPVYRSKGPLFHLYHPRNQRQLDNDLQEEIKNRREFLKICRMSKDELTDYIKTWKAY